MNKTFNSLSEFCVSQKSLICSLFLLYSFTGLSQNSVEPIEKEQIQLKEETPIFSTQEEKEAWLKEKTIKTSSTAIFTNTSTTAIGVSKVNTSTSSNSEVEIEKESTFPKYIETGDPIKDSENYAVRKQKWIEQNPEAYQELINPKK